MMYGKVPPQATDVESVVLGAILLDREAFYKASEIIHADCFYRECNQEIFRAMDNLSRTHQPIDINTVTEELKRMEKLEVVGGSYYVSKLTNDVVSSYHLENHCRIVMERFLAREMIRISADLLERAYDQTADIFETIDHGEVEMANILKNNIRKPFKKIDTVIVEAIKELEELRHRQEDITGVPSGYPDLDNVTCGWQYSDLIILAARPSVGKTAFAMNLARNAALHPVKPTPTAIFSLEMKDTQLVQRVLAAESGIWLWKVRNGRMEDHEMKRLYTQGVQAIARAGIWVDDTAGIDLDELCSKIRLLVAKHGVRLVIIDYLQLIRVKGITIREQQIAEITRRLKGLAKELNIAIIALAQLSRDVEKRGGEGEPKPSDLRESGAIEQDADLISFLWRPTDVQIQQDRTLSEVTYMKIAKNRNGALAKFLGLFKKELQKWESMTVVDESTLQPISGSWRPVDLHREAVDYTEPKKHTDPEEDLPF